LKYAFYKNNVIRTQLKAHFRTKFKNKVRTIPASAEEQSLINLIKNIAIKVEKKQQQVQHN